MENMCQSGTPSYLHHGPSLGRQFVIANVPLNSLLMPMDRLLAALCCVCFVQQRTVAVMMARFMCSPLMAAKITQTYVLLSGFLL